MAVDTFEPLGFRRAGRRHSFALPHPPGRGLPGDPVPVALGVSGRRNLREGDLSRPPDRRGRRFRRLEGVPSKTARADRRLVSRHPLFVRPSTPAEEAEGEEEGADGPDGQDEQRAGQTSPMSAPWRITARKALIELGQRQAPE